MTITTIIIINNQQQQQYGGGQQGDNQNLLAVRNFLQENYPSFYTLLNMNDDVWKAIGEDDYEKGEVGYTIFAISDEAFSRLGETKQSQLMDPRNLETTQKIAGYHVINEVVTVD